MIQQVVLTFAAMVALDIVWAKYTIYLVEKKSVLAGAFAAAIMLFNSVVVISYSSDHWMVLPAMAGAFVGTFVASKWRTT